MTTTLRLGVAALALSVLICCSLVLAMQGAPPQASPAQPPPARDMNAYYTLGPDSLEREGVAKGSPLRPRICLDGGRS